MEKSDNINELVAALVQFHSEVGKITKESNNPFFRSKYASLPDILDQVTPILVKHNLAVTQFPAGNNGLTTMLSHSSGQYMMDTYFMTPAKNDPQGIGSCITYQRRYALGAVLSLSIDEDDDGNSASGNGQQQAKKPQQLAQTPVPIPRFPETVKFKIDNAKTVEELTGIHSAHTELHKNDAFIKAMGARKKELKQKAVTA